MKDSDGSPVALGFHTGHWELSSLVEKSANTINELGFAQQVELIKQIKNLTGSYPAVIDSKDILLDPKLIVHHYYVKNN